ncbi:MAG: carboxylate--amine ligase [Phycisphaerae bacterium]|nr:carboxylate--amine ligase [Phycisphaerae bacterium]
MSRAEAMPSEAIVRDSAAIPLAWRARANVDRLWRWEFWPRSIFYAPLVPALALLALRYRSATVWTAANPAMPHGGVAGERKSQILAALPAPWALATELIPLTTGSKRLEQLLRAMDDRDWSFPVVLKPDVGERGAGVRLVRDCDEAAAAISACSYDLVAQPYHPGPFEAGVFYVRQPGATSGSIFSITDKRFPTVTGDGRSSIRRLIWKDTRLRMQAARFLERLGPSAKQVPATGAIVRLAIAGNHCQGTLFADGVHLITPALTRRFDDISRAFPGFYFGRFDVRYRSVESFMAGTDFGIVELNGVLSESTNIYDPTRSLVAAYATLIRQWSAAFAIGAANARAGHRVSGVLELWRLLRSHASRQAPSPLAD